MDNKAIPQDITQRIKKVINDLEKTDEICDLLQVTPEQLPLIIKFMHSNPTEMCVALLIALQKIKSVVK